METYANKIADSMRAELSRLPSVCNAETWPREQSKMHVSEPLAVEICTLSSVSIYGNLAVRSGMHKQSMSCPNGGLTEARVKLTSPRQGSEAQCGDCMRGRRHEIIAAFIKDVVKRRQQHVGL